MDKYAAFNMLDGMTIKIPYNAVELVVQNAYVSNESFEFTHMHHCYELYMVIEGSFILQIEGKMHVMGRDDICWIGPGVEHLDIYKDNPNHVLLVVTFDFVPSSVYPRKNDAIEEEELKMLIKHANTHRYWIGKDIRNCRRIFESICSELSRCEAGSYLIVANLLTNLIICIIQCMKLTPQDYRHPLINARASNRARQITLYLDQHYAENITLQQAAEHLNITPRHINRVLNEHYNMTFSKMLTVTRLAHAKLYMRNSVHSIEKIAELVGFSSVRILYKIFKEVEGITISQYRKKY